MGRIAKMEVEHYYEVRRGKYEVASNRNDLCFGGSKKLIGKRGAVNDMIENRSHRKFSTCILSKGRFCLKQPHISLDAPRNNV